MRTDIPAEVRERLRKLRIKAFKDHVWGPVASTILNVGIILLLMFMVTSKGRQKDDEIQVQVIEPEEQKLDELEKELEKLEDVEEVTDVPIENMDIQMEQTPTDSMASPQPNTEFTAIDIMSAPSPLIMKGLYAGRSSGGRAAMLGKYGGGYGGATEASVVKALDWLKDRQNKQEGSWDPIVSASDKQAMTGLALLTFLAHGETPNSAKYGETVEKAIKFLVQSQDEGGYFTKKRNNELPYTHAICTYAVSEAYALTRIPALKDVMEKGVRIIVTSQQGGGAWNYNYDKGPRCDASVSGWQVQALKAATGAGAHIEGMKECKERAVQWYKNDFNAERNMFGYKDKTEANKGMTGVGILALQFLGQGKCMEVQKALEYLDQTPELFPNWEKHVLNSPLYGWYYLAQAAFQGGGALWTKWNRDMAVTLVKAQLPDGHWEYPPPNGQDTEIGAGQGPVYSTTMAAMMLMVYYRHLPTFQVQEVEEVPEDTKSVDDVTVEII